LIESAVPNAFATGRDPEHATLTLTRGLLTLLTRRELEGVVAHELSQVISILEFVARGNGVSVLASLAVPEHQPGLVFLPITPRTSRRVAIACLDEKRLSPAALAFWKMARTESPTGRR